MANAVDGAIGESPKPGPGRGRQFLRGQSIYLKHVLALVAPGRRVDVPVVHQIVPGTLDKWEKDDYDRLIDEGHRQLDGQLSDLKELRSRSQWLFTVGSAAAASLGAAFVKAHPSARGTVVGLLALLALLYGIAGVAAIMAVRADFIKIDTALLSQKVPPISRELAVSYSRMLGTGENTVAARLTIFRQAVVFLILGGCLGLVAVFAIR